MAMEFYSKAGITENKYFKALHLWLGDSAGYATRLLQSASIRHVVICIALLVFSLQTVVVVNSYQREKNHQLSLIDSAWQGWVNAALSVNSTTTSTEESNLQTRLDAQLALNTSAPFNLLGYKLVQFTELLAKSSSIGTTAGNSKNLGLGKYSVSPSKRYFVTSGYFDTRVLLASASQAATDETGSALFLRVDASHIGAALTAQLWKSIVSLLLIIFVTVSGLLLLMRKRILEPFLDSGKTAERLKNFSRMNANILWETDKRLRLTFIENNVTSVSENRDTGFADCFKAGLGRLADNEDVSAESVLNVLSASGVSNETIDDIVVSLKKTGSWEGDIPAYPEDVGGDAVPNVIKIVAEPINGADSELLGYRGLLQDNSENAGRSRELEFQANHDQLTGLSNRRALEAKLDDIFKQYPKDQASTSVCMLDLDQFKLVNDSCGHAAGDALLLQVAKLLESAVRSSDMVARVGGDEFCIVLENCPIAKALEIAEKIRVYIKDYRFNWRGTTYIIGVSIGIVEISDEFDTPADLVTAADACLYRSKRSGRDQIQLHSANDEVLQQQRAELESINSIKGALEEGRFVLFFQQLQPCESSRNEKSGKHQQVFAEVLVRMITDTGKTLLPDEFLPVAERFNLLTEIDRYICNKLFIQLTEASKPARSQKQNLRISFNLSALSVVDRAFQSFLLESLEQAAFDTSSLYFEIPESSMGMDFDLVAEFIHAIAETGCGVIIDDFGYGSVSVSQIQGQPISALKLSSNLTDELDKNHLSEIVLRGIVDAGPMLDVDLIAQHVEDMNLELLLLSYEFDFLQGIYYSEPQAFASIAELQELAVAPALTAGEPSDQFAGDSGNSGDDDKTGRAA